MTHIFGSEFEEIWPKSDSALQLGDFSRNLLEKCKVVKKPVGLAESVDLKLFMRHSSDFPLEFGTNTCRVLSQPKERHSMISEQIVSAYPVLHERTLALYLNFLEHKTHYGNKRELDVYRKLDLIGFVQRLLTKRCASFFSKNDKYLLVTRERGVSGFMSIGTDQEKPPLTLEHVLSYDEIKLSSLLSVSSHTEFINDGTRANCGVIERDKSRIERAGVIVGIVGARLSRRDVMEFQDIVISRTQNSKENGYGFEEGAKATNQAEDYRRIWREFYDEKRDHLYSEVSIDERRFGRSGNKLDVFDNLVMKKRLTISFDTLLLECEARAAAAGKQAYLHVVGIGLGVWKIAEQQEKIFLLTFEQRLNHLLPKLTHISFVHFSWFKLGECGGLKNGTLLQSATHPSGGIRVFLSKRNPAEKLHVPEHENSELLLVVSYAWDGNALPGNEFWMKMLKSTGDSSTACSTLITELHNPHINAKYVCGENLHVATEKYGVMHIAEYAKNILK